MARQPDQRSYSVDEMMEKLKAGEREKRRSEDAELVTRPDGSQVVRVRKRKRRTNQPAKTKRIRRRRYGLIACCAVVVLLIGVASVALVLLAKFNSKGFREGLKERLTETTGAQIGISDLSVTPFKAQADSVQLAWSAGGVPKTLKLSELEGELLASSFLQSELKGREMVANSGSMVLGPPDDSITPTVTEGKFPLSFDGYRCPRFDLVFGEDLSAPLMKLRASELVVRPREEGGLRMTLTGGYLGLGDLGELRVESALGEWHDGFFNLASLYARSGEQGGEAVFKGVKPISSSGSALFDIELKQYPLAEVLGQANLGNLLDGVVNAPGGALSFDPRQVDSATLQLAFSGRGGRMQGFRFLGALASMLQKDYYARPEGGAIQGVLRRDREGMSIDNFKFEAAQLRMEGELRLAPNKELSGTLKVGLPEELMMLNQTQRRYRAFTMPEAGYCWIEIRLAGTAARPSDSLLDQLQAVPGPATRPPADPVPQNPVPRLNAPAPEVAPGGPAGS